jgi:hypothetical protein
MTEEELLEEIYSLKEQLRELKSKHQDLIYTVCSLINDISSMSNSSVIKAFNRKSHTETLASEVVGDVANELAESLLVNMAHDNCGIKEIIEELIETRFPEVSRILVGQELPEELLENIYSKMSWSTDICEELAHNRKCPDSIVEKLVSVKNHWRVRLAVAGRKNLSKEIFGFLSADPEKEVVNKALKNPECPSIYKVMA